MLSTKPVATAVGSEATPEPVTKTAEDDAILKKGGIDRLRLLLIYMLSSDKVKPEDIDELKNVLASTYPDLPLDSLTYLRSRAIAAPSEQEESHGGLSRIFSSVAKSGLNMVKEFLSADKHLITQQMVKMMLEKGGSENFITLDVVVMKGLIRK